MKKVLLLAPLSILAVVALFYALNAYIYAEKQGESAPKRSHQNATYVIDGTPIMLVNGQSEFPAAPGSASIVRTRYFGNEVAHDFDKDGRVDVAFLLTQETGGSGTFFYLVAARSTENGFIGSHGILLGDRIAPQTTEMGKGDIVVVNFADRAPGESFVTPPSHGKSMWLLLDPVSMQFGEVAQDFEGEADPSRMTLEMKPWTWVRAEYNDGKVVTPNKKDAFTLTFKKDGTFSATTDCNQMGGSYAVNKNQITFGNMYSTKMFCEGSQEGEFGTMLGNIASYFFTSKGELIMEIKFDSGTVFLK